MARVACFLDPWGKGGGTTTAPHKKWPRFGFDGIQNAFWAGLEQGVGRLLPETMGCLRSSVCVYCVCVLCVCCVCVCVCVPPQSSTVPPQMPLKPIVPPLPVSTGGPLSDFLALGLILKRLKKWGTFHGPPLVAPSGTNFGTLFGTPFRARWGPLWGAP